MVSYGLLWALVIIQGLILTGALRQIGQIWLRLGPERPLDRPTDLEIGQRLQADWLPIARNRRAILFVSPTCGVCEAVLSGLKPLMRSHEDLIIVCQATAEAAALYLAQYQLGEFPVVPDPDGALSSAAGINETPLAVVIDNQQRVERTAIVNTPQQVESLLLAQASGA